MGAWNLIPGDFGGDQLMAPTGSSGLTECWCGLSFDSAFPCLGTQSRHFFFSVSDMVFFVTTPWRLGEGQIRLVLGRLDGLKLRHHGWCLLPVGGGGKRAGRSLCL